MNNKIAVLKDSLANGVSPAMATPLTDEYRINTAVLPQLVNFLIDAGVKGLFVGGSTGEGILLDNDERICLHEETMRVVNGRVPVLLHVGANRMDTAVALTQHAASLNPEAIVAVTPYFYGVDNHSLLTYFQTIAQAAPEIPLMVYDIPQLATNGINPALLIQLNETIPTLAGVKTSRTDSQIIRQLIDASPDHIIILAGNEPIALGSLAMGADGLISGLSTAVPEPFVALTKTFSEGDLDTARQQQRLINQLGKQLPAGQRIGAIKQILIERGIAVGKAIPPRFMPFQPIWPQMEQLLVG